MEFSGSVHHTPKSSPMDAYIHIPKPCNENWENMVPEDKGRHCLLCSKTVIDFTGWEATEIAAYLKAQTDTKVCGRFRQEQLTTPVIEAVQRIYYANLSLLKKIAAVFVIAFGLSASSCSPKMHTSGPQILGEIAEVDSIAEKPSQHLPDDETVIIAGQIQYIPQ